MASSGSTACSSSLKMKFSGPFILLFVLLPTVMQASPAASSLRSSAKPRRLDAGVRLIRLQKRRIRGTRNSSAAPDQDDQSPDRTFYVGRLLVGQPERRLLVAFDTGFGQVVLPSPECVSATCLEHRCYPPEASGSAVDINANGAPVQDGIRLAGHHVTRDTISIGFSSHDLGDGKVTGELVKERVCLESQRGPDTCAQVGLVAATLMTDVPFKAMPYDGRVGLGLAGLSINPLFNFLGRLLADSPGLTPRFGLFLGRRSGELALGGYNPARIAAPLEWTPVERPEEGYWQVRVRSVRAGNRSLGYCGEGGVACRAIIDTGASHLGVPAAFMPALQEALSAAPGGGGPGGLLCPGPDLHFELDGTTLTLGAEDYAGPAPGCEPLLTSLQLPQESFAGAFVLGEAVLRRHYLAFNLDPPRVGFAPALGPGEAPTAEEDAFEAAEDAAAMVEAADARVKATAAAAAALAQRAAQVEGPFHERARLSQAQGTTLLLLQALVVQVLVVLLLSFTSIYKSTLMMLTRAHGVLLRSGLLPEAVGLVIAVPAGEEPLGDECSICLGSCEEDTCTMTCGGQCASRLQAGLRLFGLASGAVPQRPRWCRLRCGHHFHEQCIYEWLWKVPRCPVCRFHLLGSGATPWGKGLLPAVPRGGAAAAGAPAVLSPGLVPMSGA